MNKIDYELEESMHFRQILTLHVLLIQNILLLVFTLETSENISRLKWLIYLSYGHKSKYNAFFYSSFIIDQYQTILLVKTDQPIEGAIYSIINMTDRDWTCSLAVSRPSRDGFETCLNVSILSFLRLVYVETQRLPRRSRIN